MLVKGVPRVHVYIRMVRYVNKTYYPHVLDICVMLSYNHNMSQVLLWFTHAALTHWGWVTHICFSKLTIIGLDNGKIHRNRNWNSYIFIQEIATILSCPQCADPYNSWLLSRHSRQPQSCPKSNQVIMKHGLIDNMDSLEIFKWPLRNDKTKPYTLLLLKHEYLR